MRRLVTTVALAFFALFVARESRADMLPPLPEPTLVNRLSNLTIAPGGVFDINRSATIIWTDALRSQFDNIGGHVVSGMNGHDQNGLTNWNGPGIKSTWARTGNVAAAYDRYSIGVVWNGDFDAIGIESAKTDPFWGVSGIKSDSVFFWATYNGDANLDGAVNHTDYEYWLAGSGGSTGVTGWLAGDFNYDGATDMQDLEILQANGVPEPATFVLLGMGAAGLWSLAWRRRKRTSSGPARREITVSSPAPAP